MKKNSNHNIPLVRTGGSPDSSKISGVLFGRNKRHKFGAVKTTVDGIKFDSKGEAKRYQELLWLERGKKIIGLARQVKFPIGINGILVCNFIADFVYEENKKFIAEDFKGFMTPIASLKHKMFRACYPSWELRITKGSK